MQTLLALQHNLVGVYVAQALKTMGFYVNSWLIVMTYILERLTSWQSRKSHKTEAERQFGWVEHRRDCVLCVWSFVWVLVRVCVCEIVLFQTTGSFMSESKPNLLN